MTINHQDIQAILKILDDSPYDELQLDGNGVSVYLKRSGDGWTQQHVTAPVAIAAAGLAQVRADEAVAATKKLEPLASEAGLVDVRATMVGTFYRAPQPGAAAFVDIGSTVTDNTVIAIIEAMKLMVSIPAQASGVVREILVDDAQFVEQGQLLMRVKPPAV